MKKDYLSNYIANFGLQLITTIVGLLSLFVVVPFLSSNKELYGIYSICISLTIFFNYADLGFVTAGQKYGAEYFAKGELQNEIRVIGFTTFMLIMFVLFVSGCMLILVFKPELLISELSADSAAIASQLMLILIIASPFMAAKKILLTVFSIRVEQYKYQTLTLVGHLFKISSVFYFFCGKDYMVVPYYLFVQIVDAFTALVLAIYANFKYGYNNNFYKQIKFDNAIFNIVKPLVLASLAGTVSWILYYELDLMILAKISSAEIVATYAAAFTLLTLVRNYLAIIYSGLTTRYNHYVGERDYIGLKKFYLNNIGILFPLVVFPICVLTLTASPFVKSWVGGDYLETVDLARILFIGNVLAFLLYPSNAYMVATNRLRSMYVSAMMLPAIFFIGVALSYSSCGILAFALFKSLALLLSALYCFAVTLKFMKINKFIVIKNTLLSYSFPLVACISVSVFLEEFMRTEKSLICIAQNIMIMACSFVIALLLAVLLPTPFKEYCLRLPHRLFHR